MVVFCFSANRKSTQITSKPCQSKKKTTTKKCLDVNEELTEKLLIFPVKTAWGVNGAWPLAYSQHELEVGHLAFHG